MNGKKSSSFDVFVFFLPVFLIWVYFKYINPIFDVFVPCLPPGDQNIPGIHFKNAGQIGSLPVRPAFYPVSDSSAYEILHGCNFSFKMGLCAARAGIPGGFQADLL